MTGNPEEPIGRTWGTPRSADVPKSIVRSRSPSWWGNSGPPFPSRRDALEEQHLQTIRNFEEYYLYYWLKVALLAQRRVHVIEYAEDVARNVMRDVAAYYALNPSMKWQGIRWLAAQAEPHIVHVLRVKSRRPEVSSN